MITAFFHTRKIGFYEQIAQEFSSVFFCTNSLLSWSWLSSEDFWFARTAFPQHFALFLSSSISELVFGVDLKIYDIELPSLETESYKLELSLHLLLKLSCCSWFIYTTSLRPDNWTRFLRSDLSSLPVSGESAYSIHI